MLGIGYYLRSALEEDEQEQASTRLLLRSPVVIVCPRIGALQSEQFQSLKTFVTINSYPSTRNMDLDTSNGCVDFVNGLGDLSQRSQR
jgi:hypothetical protein